jgi:hypothetical protein
MLKTPVNFDDLLELIDQLSSQQKQIIRQRIDEDWSRRFRAALDDIHQDMPTHISEEEVERDIEAAIEETRREQS